MNIHTMTNEHQIELPSWLPHLVIGAEGEPDGAPSESAEPPADSSDDDSTDDHEQWPEGFEQLPEDHPVKKALKAERAAHKAQERENRKLAREAAARKTADDEAELAKKGEIEVEKARREKAEQRATSLAAGFLKSAIDRAIEREARDAKFIDMDDALAGVDRMKITSTQDDDDPAEVQVDLKSVKEQIKALATRKPHLIKAGTEDGMPSGSQFGAGGPKGGKKPDEDVLKQRYPSLR